MVACFQVLLLLYLLFLTSEYGWIDYPLYLHGILPVLYLTFLNKYVLIVDLFIALLLQAHISVPHSPFVDLEWNANLKSIKQ